MTENRKYGLLGTSIWQGQPKPGVDRSYDYLKLVGFWDELKKEAEFHNFGVLEKANVDQVYNNLFHKTLEMLNSGFNPILLGGDHSQAFSSISALTNKYSDLRIIWVDAHADINTPETSPSGNSHGMPLSGLLGMVDKNIWGMPWMNQLLKPEQIVQIGIRDIDEGERVLLQNLNIEYYSPESMREKGLDNILNELSQKWKGHPLHLSFDIDGLDQSLVPATGTPVGDGLTLEEGLKIIDRSKNDFNFLSCEIVEFNPDLAKNPEELHTTEETVKTLIRRVLS